MAVGRGVIGVLAAMVCGSIARAVTADPGFALEQLDPPVAGDAFVTVPSPWTPGHLSPRGMVTVDYARDPLRLVGPGRQLQGAIVSSQLFLHADAAMTFWNRALVAVDLPAALLQSGDAPVSGNVPIGSPRGASLGDLRIALRSRLFGNYHFPFQIGIGTNLYLPTGPRQSYTSDHGVGFRPLVLLGGRAPHFVWAANGGAVLRTSGNPHAVAFGAAAGVVLAHGIVQLGPEFFGTVALGDTLLPASGTPPLRIHQRVGAEGLLSARFRVRGFSFAIAVGTGLVAGPGTPTVRGVASLAYAPEPADEPDGDRDGDGVRDLVDRCPSQPGSASDDPRKNGCPPDHDGDGIADADDACPRLAGAPSRDRRKNGCPPDRDGDGVVDAADGCPAEPGVADAAPSKNGCPRDRDRDHIADSKDACPDLPGVVSDDRASNGCPRDRDGDGIDDVVDACPAERGVDDPDPQKRGCPRAVRVTEKEIVILQQVKFRSGGAGLDQTVDPVSEELLSEVRGALEDHPEITKIEVQGHTDNDGSPGYNEQLSQKRAQAVRAWLIAHGIANDKLTAHGFGMRAPLADNATPAGRQKNRRVEFKILERAKPP